MFGLNDVIFLAQYFGNGATHNLGVIYNEDAWFVTGRGHFGLMNPGCLISRWEKYYKNIVIESIAPTRTHAKGEVGYPPCF